MRKQSVISVSLQTIFNSKPFWTIWCNHSRNISLSPSTRLWYNHAKISTDSGSLHTKTGMKIVPISFLSGNPMWMCKCLWHLITWTWLILCNYYHCVQMRNLFYFWVPSQTTSWLSCVCLFQISVMLGGQAAYVHVTIYQGKQQYQELVQSIFSNDANDDVLQHTGISFHQWHKFNKWRGYRYATCAAT